MALFIHLLISANQKKNKFYWNGQEIEVEMGQLITGRNELSKQTGITQRSIRTALYILKSTSTIAIKTTNRFSLISILNWNEYQSKPTNQTTSISANNRPATDQLPTTNNNEKNEENEKNNNNVFVEKIATWAYERARVNPSCTREAFKKSVESAISRVGEVRIKRLFEVEENAIQFLKNIKTI